ncbi:hypothetical protein E3E12_07455 [Formicincola oecophyllae]|uniref:Uncharacterized protein n=1 Tax=Formicincola oecophyllae TaxID=2558361 RepID=A0A4Y6UCC6_9PROT|nr:hypothetical protein [Formicincola oecophyllae]QDH14041.1 hypothetical protein E3E12_07455 [Formicincola oecophyllae]
MRSQCQTTPPPSPAPSRALKRQVWSALLGGCLLAGSCPALAAPSPTPTTAPDSGQPDTQPLTAMETVYNGGATGWVVVRNLSNTQPGLVASCRMVSGAQGHMLAFVTLRNEDNVKGDLGEHAPPVLYQIVVGDAAWNLKPGGTVGMVFWEDDKAMNTHLVAADRDLLLNPSMPKADYVKVLNGLPGTQNFTFSLAAASTGAPIASGLAVPTKGIAPAVAAYKSCVAQAGLGDLD